MLATEPGVDPTRIFVSSASAGFDQELTAAECFTFSVAPDDSLVAFTRTDGATVALYVVAPDGTGESAISLTPATAQRVRATSVPVWAPDSSAILYAERITSLLKYELHLTAPDGSGNVTLSDIEGSANELEDYSFSPDGSQVVFGAYSASGMLYRVSLDGSGRTLLTDNVGGEDARASSLRDDAGSVNGLQLAP